MKRTIVAGIMGMILMVSAVFALTTPLPIVVVVSPIGQNTQYLVSVTNLRTNEVMSGYTNSAGEFAVEWGNSVSGFNTGDQFKITMGTQTRTITYVNIGGTLFKDATGNPLTFVSLTPIETVTCNCHTSNCPTCPSCGTCPAEKVCPTCYCNATICPAEKICPGVPICPAPIVCPGEKVCPTGNTNLFDSLLAYVLALVAGAGIGFVVRRNKDGSLSVQATQHKHFGMEYYHSINTIHKNINITHPKGELVPLYKDEKYVPKTS